MLKYYQYNASESALISDRNSLNKYFRKDLGWGKGYQSRAVFNLLIRAADHCKKGTVLDAGAGHQRYRPFFYDSLYLSQEHHEGIDFKGMGKIQYDLIGPIDSKIPLKDACVEGVVSTSVLEHLARPDIFCQEAYRVLKPGGKIFINVPFSMVEHEAPYDYNRPTRYAIRKWLSDGGFAGISVSPSSSCTEAICCALPVAAFHDVLKTDRGVFENLREVSAKNCSVWVKIPQYGRIFFATMAYVMTKLICDMLLLLIDRGPYKKALAPVGWIAEAKKPGSFHRSKTVQDRAEFLKKNAK